MIKLRQTEYENIVYIEADGKVTGEDARRSEAFIQSHFGEKQSISALVNIKNIESTNFSGIVKGMILDIRHWGQFKKFAVITEESWIETGAKAINLAPGITVKNFKSTRIEHAWKWLLE